MKRLSVGVLAMSALVVGCTSNASPPAAGAFKPTIVLVHGAFAESSSWNGVVAELTKAGYPVIAAANPLRGVESDATEISDLLSGLDKPVVLVGHSYGGAVITEAANGHSNVKALVYVSAFAPDKGDSSFSLTAHDPGSTLSGALATPVKLTDGSHDLYVDRAKFRSQFAADVPADQAALMAATQRPLRDAAGDEKSGNPSWKTIPSWAIYGSADRNISPLTLAFMAKRANSRHTVEIKGASHVVMVSHPKEVAALIEEAAASAGGS